MAVRANLTRTEGAPQKILCVQSFEGPHLVLDAPGTALQIRRGELCLRRGDGAERLFPPRKHGLRHIVLATSAGLTTDALRWLVAEDVMLTVSGQPHLWRDGVALPYNLRRALNIIGVEAMMAAVQV
jgi:hypothetical protein